jgi:hypothetical protein
MSIRCMLYHGTPTINSIADCGTWDGQALLCCWDFLPADKQIFGEQGALKVPGHGAHFIAVIKPRHDLRREVVSPA